MKTNEYITNPSVRRLLAQEIWHDRKQWYRHPVGSSTREFFRMEYKERFHSFRLFAQSTQYALERGDLQARDAEDIKAELQKVLNMLDGLKPDLSNGVKDYSGTMDEGEVLASGILDSARAALLKVTK